jgi:predicted house-cleaning noncanonical NTP pyrophosphatase (MazG superfamily)
MKNSKRKDYFTGASSEDPVDDFAELARNEWDKAKRKNQKESKKRGDNNIDGTSDKTSDDNDDDDEDDDDEYQHSTMEKMLRDVIGSKALQQAAQQFVVQILESDDFKTALLKLVQELWKDLLQDPETLAQVIHVLQVSIRTPQVQHAAQELVVDLVADPQVKQALITLLQRLGAERDVLQATQTLLTNATHQSLADPEILEHSMEFATDVLGDDIVQQSAGEALRNSVGHAIGHSLFNPNTILTVVGVGFFLVGMIALGNVSTSTAATATTAVTATITNSIGHSGGKENSSSRSIDVIGGAAGNDVTTSILHQLWDMTSTAMATIVHALVISPICYLGRGMVHAVTCTLRVAYQHIVVPPLAASGQQLVTLFVTPSNALLARLVNVFQQAYRVVDISRYSRRIMWYDLNTVVANTVDTVWTALYTTIATWFEWIALQSFKVQDTILTTMTFREWTIILRAWGATVLDQSRHFITSSMQYLSQTTMQMVRFLHEWFILATL